MVYREAPLTLTHERDVWLLRARLIGAPVDQQTQELHADVKGSHEASLRTQADRRSLEGTRGARRMMERAGRGLMRDASQIRQT